MLNQKEIVALLKKSKCIYFDFDGVFTDNKVYVSEDGKESVLCSREDGMGISLLKKLNIPAYVVSTEINPVVSARAKKLGLLCYQGVSDKAKLIKGLARQDKIKLEEAIFVGNDINDINALEIVGLPIIVNDAHNDVKEYAKYITKNKGGNGAVREICDLLYKGRIDTK